MDEIEDFFNISKDFKRVSAPVPKPIIEEGPSTSAKVKREYDADKGPSKFRKVIYNIIFLLDLSVNLKENFSLKLQTKVCTAEDL